MGKIKMTGLDNALKGLKELQANVEKASDERHIPLNELLTEAFLDEHADCSSLSEFFKRGGFDVSTPEAFRAIPCDELDDYVSSCTDFESWSEILVEAARLYYIKELGL